MKDSASRIRVIPMHFIYCLPSCHLVRRNRYGVPPDCIALQFLSGDIGQVFEEAAVYEANFLKPNSGAV